ncbi:hypothetical protein SDC9_204077 [bioreactor metagenome]|uniref:Uncharacterized protein n=1 Tax=bioreactor metagenome TaxID=1076179 RepID=A0A645J102_9ZZZZ
MPELLLNHVSCCKGRSPVEHPFIKPVGLQKPVGVSNVSTSGTIVLAVISVVSRVPSVVSVP